MARRVALPVLAAVVVALAVSTPVAAHHPTSGGADPRCADWAAGNGPAGIDMTSICIAQQVVGTYTAQGTTSDPLLPFLGAALVAGMGLALVGVLALRVASKPAARRLAPEQPLAWWVCGSCRSVNAAGREACYACRSPAPEFAPEAASEAGPPASAEVMTTAATPSFEQRFGRPS